MLSKLLPRDEGFFELFNQLSAHLVRSAQLLDRLFAEPESPADMVKAIKEEEHRADELMAVLAERIDRTFITPIDREDILLLASRLDDVVDLIDGTARRLEMLHVRDRREEGCALTAVLVKASEQLQEAVFGMKRPTVVKDRAIEIKRLEEEGDMIYHQAVGSLFAGAGGGSAADVLEVMKWKEMFDTLERCIDACQGVGTVLQSISLKHA
ncbi:MAG TPA: DUF47 family protein [Gemmatimonadaceae bacterium]